jgi:hypothetical protein
LFLFMGYMLERCEHRRPAVPHALQSLTWRLSGRDGRSPAPDHLHTVRRPATGIVGAVVTLMVFSPAFHAEGALTTHPMRPA